MAVATYTVGAGSLSIGAAGLLTTFGSQATNVRLVPKSDIGDTIYVLSGESVAGDFLETYTLEGTLLQDLGATAKTEWLFEHSGETHVFEFIPNTVAARKITGSLVVTAVEIGGDVKTKPTSDFSFTVVGKPVIAATP